MSNIEKYSRAIAEKLRKTANGLVKRRDSNATSGPIESANDRSTSTGDIAVPVPSSLTKPELSSPDERMGTSNFIVVYQHAKRSAGVAIGIVTEESSLRHITQMSGSEALALAMHQSKSDPGTTYVVAQIIQSVTQTQSEYKRLLEQVKAAGKGNLTGDLYEAAGAGDDARAQRFLGEIMQPSEPKSADPGCAILPENAFRDRMIVHQNSTTSSNPGVVSAYDSAVHIGLMTAREAEIHVRRLAISHPGTEYTIVRCVRSITNSKHTPENTAQPIKADPEIQPQRFLRSIESNDRSRFIYTPTLPSPK